MKRFYVLALALTLGTASVQATVAQGGGGQGRPGGGFGRGMFGGGGMGLLTMPEVQKELKMTPAQVEKAKTKQDELQKSSQAAIEKAGGFQALRDLSDEDRQKLFGPLQEAQKKAVSELLNPDQQKRFHQLELQQGGARSLTTNKEVKEALKITDEQTEKMDAIQMEQRQAMQAIFQSIDPQNATADERAAMQKKMAELQKSTLDKVVAVLNEDQQKKWKEMTGEPFKFPPMRGFGGPRPPRPGN